MCRPGSGYPPPTPPFSRNPAKDRAGERCTNPNNKNTVPANLSCMSDPVLVEIVGLKYSSCSPFPCDADRTCGLSECHPSGKLTKAFDALKTVIKEIYGDRVELRLTLIDDEVPAHIR